MLQLSSMVHNNTGTVIYCLKNPQNWPLNINVSIIQLIRLEKIINIFLFVRTFIGADHRQNPVECQ